MHVNPKINAQTFSQFHCVVAGTDACRCVPPIWVAVELNPTARAPSALSAVAAECVEAAAKSTDADAAAALLVMAQKWLDLAHERLKPKDYLSLAVDEFNEGPMGNRTYGRPC
jgi:hypothetical protein